MTSLKNKVALITGSARGIGKAIAERYAAVGADLVVNYTKDEAAANETVAQAQKQGVRVIAVQADVAQVADIERLFSTATATFGQLDIVVVNAGVELVSLPVAYFTEAQYNRLFDLNTKGAFFTMQQAARHVADHGRILYIGSSTAGYPRPGYALHGGSKVAPQYLAQVLAQEVGKRGVTVNAILPTVTEGAGLPQLHQHHRVQPDPAHRRRERCRALGRAGGVERRGQAPGVLSGPAGRGRQKVH